MVKDGGALPPAIRIGPRQSTGISAGASGGISRYGVTGRCGNNDRLSTPWREVISLTGVARAFCKASSGALRGNAGQRRRGDGESDDVRQRCGHSASNSRSG